VGILVRIVRWIAGLGRIESRCFGIPGVEAELGRADGAVDSGAGDVSAVASRSRRDVRGGRILSALFGDLDYSAPRVPPPQSSLFPRGSFFLFDWAARVVLERRGSRAGRFLLHPVHEPQRLFAVRAANDPAARLPGPAVAADLDSAQRLKHLDQRLLAALGD